MVWNRGWTMGRLSEAYRTVRRRALRPKKGRVRRDTPGPDGMTVAAIDARGDTRFVIDLRDALREGRYQPHPPRFVEMVSKGKRRRIGVLNVNDRVVQRSYLDVLTPLIEPTLAPSVFGITGRGLRQAHHVVQEAVTSGRYQWAARADISHAFHHACHDIFFDAIKTRISDTRMLRLISDFLHVGALEPGFGLLQGAPLSPLFFNLMLDQVDRAFELDEVFYLRYSDDFLILTESEDAARTASNDLHGRCFDQGFGLNDKTTTINLRLAPVTFLGASFPTGEVMRLIAETGADAKPIAGACS